MKTSVLDQEFLHAALCLLGERIEICGASTELTNAVALCSDLRSAIGNKFNPPDKYAYECVLAAIDAEQRAMPRSNFT